MASNMPNVRFKPFFPGINIVLISFQASHQELEGLCLWKKNSMLFPVGFSSLDYSHVSPRCPLFLRISSEVPLEISPIDLPGTFRKISPGFLPMHLREYVIRKFVARCSEQSSRKNPSNKSGSKS